MSSVEYTTRPKNYTTLYFIHTFISLYEILHRLRSLHLFNTQEVLTEVSKSGTRYTYIILHFVFLIFNER